MGKQTAVLDNDEMIAVDEKAVPDGSAFEKPKEVVAPTRAATFDALRRKPRRVLTFPINMLDEEGEEISLEVKYRALSQTEYDNLVTEHPPTPKEKAKGAVYNADTFPPALIAAVSVQPRLSVEQATEIFKSEDWSQGEIQTLFWNAVKVCTAGLDVSFSAND